MGLWGQGERRGHRSNWQGHGMGPQVKLGQLQGCVGREGPGGKPSGLGFTALSLMPPQTLQGPCLFLHPWG